MYDEHMGDDSHSKIPTGSGIELASDALVDSGSDSGQTPPERTFSDAELESYPHRGGESYPIPQGLHVAVYHQEEPKEP